MKKIITKFNEFLNEDLLNEGVYYYPKNTDIEKLLSNFWQADFYGLIHEFSGIPSELRGMYRMPYNATDEEAKSNADKIRTAIQDKTKLYEFLREFGMMPEGINEKEVDEMVDELINFLENCGGYESE